MNKTGPIVVIDDDKDDKDVLEEIFNDLKVKNEVQYFSDPSRALAYLNQTNIKPFIIISDINMPIMNGFELRDIIRGDPALHNKCIPYLFFTTDASEQAVTQAYILSVQGIFQKPPSYDKWKDMILHIVEYWNDCISPNRYYISK